MPDLTKAGDNPTRYLHDNYQDLMGLAEEDPEAVAAQVLRAAESMVGHGLSPANFKKLRLRLQQAIPKGAFAVQKMLTDYLLGGIDPSLKVSHVQRFEEYEAIGSLVSEDPDLPPIEWTRELIAIEDVAKKHGFVIIRENMGIDPSWVDAVRMYVRRAIERYKLSDEYGPGNTAIYIPIDSLPGAAERDIGEEIYEVLGMLTDEFEIEEEGGGFFFSEKLIPGSEEDLRQELDTDPQWQV